MRHASYLDRAQRKLADLEQLLAGMGERAGVADARAELEATRERLKALRLQGAELAEDAVQSFTRRLEELSARIGAIGVG